MAGDEDKWFTGDTSKGMSGMLRYSQVDFFIDVEEYYADLRKEVESAAQEGGQRVICWAGWLGAGVTPMPASATPPTLKPFARRGATTGDKPWIDVLTAATNAGASLRVLLTLDASPSPATGYVTHCFTTVKNLNALKNTFAINDFRYLFMNGTHHQKLVVVCTPSRLIAYVGTAEVYPLQIMDRWCELTCKVQGEAARELYRVFTDRWGEHNQLTDPLPDERKSLPRPEACKVNAGGGKLITQTSTTFGNPQHASPFGSTGPAQQSVNQPHRLALGKAPVGGPVSNLLLSLLGVSVPQIGIANDFFAGRDPLAMPLLASAGAQTATYWFAPGGRTGVYHQIEAALNRCQKFIYLEDQYLVDDMPIGSLAPMLDLLEQKVKQQDFQKLVVFFPRISEINDELLGLAAVHRRAFIDRLVAAGGDKVVFCQYKSNSALGTGLPSPDGAPFYVHSKTWIFDDEFLIVGSANCNRRGYSHDSELDLAVYDVEKNAIHELRKRIWLRRLNTEGVATPVTDAEVNDFMSGAKNLWEDPARRKLTIENHRANLNAFVPVSTTQSILGSNWAQAVMPVVKAASAADVWLWDTVVDPEGT